MPKEHLPAGTIVPAHIGVIMDGNGRWAKKRGLPRKLGHRQGAKTFRMITRHAKALGVKVITFYAFSTENWKRPQDEVDALMKLFEKNLGEVTDFLKEKVRLRFIGDRSVLPASLKAKMEDAERLSKDFDTMTLVLAINYGGRSELAGAVRGIAEAVRAGTLQPKDIDEETVNNSLDTAGLPDVDLLIRPSGEMRLSNFLIWQSAYAEFYFTDILWPDFGKKDLENAIIAYNQRCRRFGGV
ncbi:MAG: isoprenyl transferase [Oscillospiraceae bacterium]